jgi:excisionase family DNA binding protein
MAAGRNRPGTTAESTPGQLTLADWERDLALEPRSATEVSATEASDAGRTQPPSRASADHELGERQLLTVAEVAQATGLSVNAIYRAIWGGELRASKLRGRIRVPAEAVTAWVDEARVLTNPPQRVRAARVAARAPRAVGSGRGLRELLHAAGPPPA